MSKQSTIVRIDQDFWKNLDYDGQLHLAACLQCARCSSGCTVRDETDILPHQINRMAIMGLADEIKSSKAIWLCVSCQTCFSRCPMKVNIPAMIDRIRAMSEDAPGDLRNVRIFNDVMLASVRRFGRAYELLLMAIYKVKSRDLFSDIARLPTMLIKGKFSLLPPKGPGGRAVSRIFEKARRLRK